MLTDVNFLQLKQIIKRFKFIKDADLHYSKTKKESSVTVKCKIVPQNLFEFPPSLNILIYNDSTVLEHYFIT